MRRVLSISVLLFSALCTAAQAGEVLLGVGRTGIGEGSDVGAIALTMEAHREAFARIGAAELRAGAAIEIDADADLWGGVGLAAMVPLNGDWRVLGSVMPGLYRQGDGLDLGGTFQTRSAIGIDRRVGPGWLGLALSHKSNAGTDDDNPGEEALMLRFAAPF
jgi:hypothetical protein